MRINQLIIGIVFLWLGLSVAIPFVLGGFVLAALYLNPLVTWLRSISVYDALTNIVYWYAVLMALTAIGSGWYRDTIQKKRSKFMLFLLIAGIIIFMLLLVGKFVVRL